MKYTVSILVSLLLLVHSVSLKAADTPPFDEGMWLPMFIKRLNYDDMKKKGLKLTPEEIYSVNSASLKDAIVMLGGGFCTAEIISSKGLLLTNHHCAYDAIQSLSTVENDLLTNGFFAKKIEEELPVEGLTASFLVRMEDVTAKMNTALANAENRQKAILETSRQIEAAATEGTAYEASVKPFFGGNEFYLFVYETFRDVRLVGNPPESVGKFGGDTDNWMWPRHTGDFSMLRVYAGANNQPAAFAAENRPLKPRHHLPISLEGVKKGDFSMVMGYPGSTNRYLRSAGVERAVAQVNPKRVEIRGKKLEIMKKYMDADPTVRLQYASKYAQVSNYWKYFIGQTKGLQRLNVASKKQAEEKKFNAWVNSSEVYKNIYNNALLNIEEGYEQMAKTDMSYFYLVEGIFGTEILPLAFGFAELEAALIQGASNEQLTEVVDGLKQEAATLFKDYHAALDQETLGVMMQMMATDLPEDQQPEIFRVVKNDYEGDFMAFSKAVFSNSFLDEQEKVNTFLANPKADVLSEDLAIQTMSSIMQMYYSQVAPLRTEAQRKLDEGNRLFMDGLRKMNPSVTYYPDANSTMRLTYGQVLDYYPADAVLYSYYTTANGILQKEDPKDPEFVVDERLKKALQAADFGQYGQNGQLRVCFISNNDITGGNSGSPVINGEGELIGLAFDGNWEAMSGDIAFETELQRCISVDIRYVLFLVDKVMGAKNIINELTLKQGKSSTTKEFTELEPKKY